MHLTALVHVVLALVLAPLLFGVIQRTKALAAGRTGAPLLQPARDLVKLLGKGAVYSRTTTWLFRAGPIVSLATPLVALALLPLGSRPSLVSFAGDFVLLAYLFGLGRFLTVAAALDTGSSFEGMGASREVLFSALAEPALFLGLAALARRTGSLSLSGMSAAAGPALWTHAGPELVLIGVALIVVLLAENSRMPVDDPTTHLELTMIHEVMVLDHGGVDLAYVLYGAMLKFTALGALLVSFLLPVRTGHVVLDGVVFAAGLVALAVLVGVIESVMARLRLVRVPQLLVSASALAAVALVLSFR